MSPKAKTISLVGREPLRTTSAAQKIMKDTFKSHALPGWTILFAEHTVKRAGSCSYRTKTIRINKLYATRVEEKELNNTVLHEIAHMIAGQGAGHGPKWKQIAKEIGCDGKVYHSFKWKLEPFVAKCPKGHYSKPATIIRWKTPLTCRRCQEWLLYYRQGSDQLVKFGGSSSLAKYHQKFEKELERK
jgi:predicted SprT family Zn-dependent metalloprotease